MTQFIEFEDSKGDYNYYAADQIGKIIVEPTDYVDGEAVAKATIYDRKGATLHTETFNDVDYLCARHAAMRYCDSVTDIIKPITPVHPGFFLITSQGPLHESIGHKAPLVGMVVNQHSFDALYVDIFGSRYRANGLFAVLNEATGAVTYTDFDNEKDMVFESIEKWLKYTAARARKEAKKEAKEEAARKKAEKARAKAGEKAMKGPWKGAKGLHTRIIDLINARMLSVPSAKQLLAHFKVARAQDLTSDQVAEAHAMVDKIVGPAAKKRKAPAAKKKKVAAAA